MGRHSAQRRSPLPLVLGFVAVLAIAAAAFFGFRILTGNDGSSQASPLPTTSTSTATSTTTPSTTSTTATPTVSAEFAAVQKALQECMARESAAQAVVDTAARGAQHWGDHVQGQNDINSGARTLLDVKTNTWAPTRKAGPTDVSDFQAAMAAYTGVSGCQNVKALPAPGELKSKLDACAAHQAALDTYVEASKAVMTDWQTHLGEMADHAEGHINSFQAQDNWLKRWREAPAHLDPYKAAAAALAAAPACTTA
ncbi:MAG TPA: hypothetical protein VI110_06770 [Lapillicoccus sp.]